MVKAPITYEESRKTRVEALERADGHSYFKSCNDLGIDPEFPELYERGEADELVEEKGLEGVIAKAPKAFKSFGKYQGRVKNDRTVDGREREEDQRFDYNRFKRTVEAGDYSISVLKQTDSKRDLLETCGLVYVTSKNGVSMALEDLDPEHIGSIFKDYYGRSVRYHREKVRAA